MTERRIIPEDVKGKEASEAWLRDMEVREGVKVLRMEKCLLEEWPANLSGDSFPGLKELYAQGNAGLEKVPEGLAPFSRLTLLDVLFTSLSTLPRDLARVCPLLEALYMNDCQFRVIPECVRELKRLKR